MLKKEDFIDFLDEYQLKKQTYYSDNINFISAVNKHFITNKLDDKLFVGETNRLSLSRPIKSVFHKAYDPTIVNTFWNNSSNVDISNIDNLYSLWQKTYETDIIVKTNHVVIDTTIEKIDDLLKIINENEYKLDTEYNINLKSLHNIKEELIKLNNMIGMETLKKSVLDQLLYFIQELHVGNAINEFKHTVINGPPGTGKTEIAKIIGTIYSKLGILKNNIFKKVTRNDLVAGYLGQTAIKTKKVIEECLGGVLFIDEAYSLASPEQNDSYSKECLDTLCEAMSDYKDNLMVIIAGYEEELEETFFRANRGLESRFIWRFKMDHYSAKELMEIFKKKVIEHEWSFDTEFSITEKWFDEKKAIFKNYGRDMELLFSYTKISHSRRIYGKDKDLRKKISLDDMNNGYEIFLKNKNKKKTSNYMHSIYI